MFTDIEFIKIIIGAQHRVPFCNFAGKLDFDRSDSVLPDGVPNFVAGICINK